MKIGLFGFAVVGFSVLCSQAVMIGQRQLIETRAVQPAGPTPYFERGGEAFVRSGSPAHVGQHFGELQRYHEINAQRAVENLGGQSLPHGTYTVPAGTKCEVLSQRATLVEVLWIDGPMLQTVGWIHATDLTEESP